ncbi:ADP-ribose pyrophosphatase [Phycisphaerales bacterium]|nr:ADP-ribose pyrophosphatase [Phycisphaerales bacterium]
MPDHAVSGSSAKMPYRIACLCDLRDHRGRVLLLKRKKAPNDGMCSPIGGKLDVQTGESPAQCAQREIKEEAGLDIPIERLHLIGLVSEAAYEGGGHWLMFVYRVLGPVWVEPHEIREGLLDWFTMDELEGLPLPESDRRIIWPLLKRAETPTGGAHPGFFAVHIDCTDGGMRSVVEQETGGR